LLYGLKQALRSWYTRLSYFLLFWFSRLQGWHLLVYLVWWH
jgi:hypothetical protein